MKTKTLPRRLVAVLLTLMMVLSVFTASFTSASAANEWYDPANYTIKGLKVVKDLAKNTKFIKAYGGYIGIALDILSAVIDFCKEDEPSDEEIKIDYLIEQVDAMKNQINVMATDLKSFLTNNNKLQGFDSAFMAVEHNFGVDYQENFEKMVSAYATDENISEATRLQLLSNLIGDSSTWHQSNSVIYNYDTYANYLLGSTTVFSGSNIYQAAIDFYKDSSIFGQEVRDKYDGEFFARSYSMYLYAMTKLITCLEARKDLMISVGDEPSLLEANACIRKIDAYVQSLAPILKLYNKTRATVNPCEFYDRSNSSQPMQTKLLNKNIGYYSLLETAADRYNHNLQIGESAVQYTNFLDLKELSTNTLKKIVERGVTFAYQSMFINVPRVEDVMEDAGMEEAQLTYFYNYMTANYSGTSLREFLTHCGFDTDTALNREALYLVQGEASTKTVNYDKPDHEGVIPITYYRYNGLVLDSESIEREEKYIYNDPMEEYKAGKYDLRCPYLYFRTVDMDRTPLDEALAMALNENQRYDYGYAAYTAESIQNMMSFVAQINETTYTSQADIVSDAQTLYDRIFSLQRDDDVPLSITDISEHAVVEATVNGEVVTIANPGDVVKIKAVELEFGCGFNHFNVTTAKAGAPIELSANNTFIMPEGPVNVECVVDFTDFTFWVNGVSATHDNFDDICGDGKVSFDPKTQTLTLNNVNFTNTHNIDGIEAVIISTFSFNINLIGDNNLFGSGSGYGIYAGDFYYGVPCDVNVTGSGILEIGDVDYGIHSSHGSVSFNADAGILSNNTAVSAVAVTLGIGKEIGFPVGGQIQNGVIVKANGSTADTVLIQNRDNGILGDANVSERVDIRDVTQIQRHIAELELLNDYQQELADVDRDEGVTILDATEIQLVLAEFDSVYLIGTSVRLIPMAITFVDAYGTTTATVNGASVTSAKAGAVVDLSFAAEPGVSFTGWNVEGGYDTTITMLNDHSFVMPDSPVTVTSNTSIPDYGLRVGSIEVNSQNKSNVLGNGRVSYDPSTQTLYMKNGTNISESYDDGYQSYGIFSNHALNINVTGNCSVQAHSDYGVFSNGALTISGSGRLTVNNAMNGVYAGNGDLTFNALANVSASYFAVGADNNIIIGSGFAIGTPANAVNQSGMIFNGSTPATQVAIVAN